MTEELVGTFVGRWYVSLFGLTFLVSATRQLGLRKALTFLGVATLVGAVAENGSVHLGVPYTRYAFDESLRGDEVFLGDVPLMVPLSYSFMAYFAFMGGRLLAAGPHRTRAPRLWHEVLLAWVLAVWAIWILDPVSRLGEHFYLGELFRYDGPGFWFGLPLGSQLGFALTSGLCILALHLLDRDSPGERVPAGLRAHPHGIALLTWHAQVFHMAAIAFWLDADTLGGSALLMWIPAAVLTAVLWSQLRPQDDGQPVDAARQEAGLPLERAGELVGGPARQ